jgi:hypothetical protein
VSNRFSEYAMGVAGIIAVLWLTFPHAAGQTARGSAAGCPDESALFHPCALAKAKGFRPLRTSDDRPDMQGMWRGGPAHGTENIEEHPSTPDGDDDGGKSLIVDPPDGKVPYQPWALAQTKENRAKYIDPNLVCFLSGVPRTMYVPTVFQILQTPGHVVMLLERAHAFRIIPTDGRSHLDGKLKLWNGDPRGRWEGNTLVVDVTNQNARPWFDQAANFYTDAAHMVERFTLIDPDTLHYEVSIEDPNVYTRPWKMAFPIRRFKQKEYEFLEEACHEGERDGEISRGLGYRFYPGARLPSSR